MSVSVSLSTEEPAEKEDGKGDENPKQEGGHATQAIVIGVWSAGAVMSLLVTCFGVRLIVRQRRLVSYVVRSSHHHYCR